jgi:cytochrome c-type biogenesis protein CcmH
MGLGRFDEAFAAYEQALTLTNGSPKITDELSRAREFALQGPPPTSSAPESLAPKNPAPKNPADESSAPRGPSADDIEAAAAMTPEDRSAMVESMVAGLAARLRDNPNDPAGWARLIRARKVLGQTKEAEADIAFIKQTYADDPNIAAQILTQAGWSE